MAVDPLELSALISQRDQLKQQLNHVESILSLHRSAEVASTTPTHNHTTTTVSAPNEDDATGPFEGPEKLLEIWWTDSKAAVRDGKGLRNVKRDDWESMLDEVHCKVLSVIQGDGVDAYMLSESSMFVWPHKLILKTCGTTTLLLGLHTILRLAKEAGFTNGIWRAFYSRKSFMFPERQKGPHRDWRNEMEVLDSCFSGNGYTVGPMNGDHWLLYMTYPNDAVLGHTPHVETPRSGISASSFLPIQPVARKSPPDQTLEILMSDLDPSACANFYFPTAAAAANMDGHTGGTILSNQIGLADLFGPKDMHLDAYLFQPCGFSANIITQRDRYATIHVTPEADWSYASFETNMAFGPSGQMTTQRGSLGVQELVEKVLAIFKPGRWSLTLFVAREEDEPETTGEQGIAALHEGGFPLGWKRTDKIVYDFGDYDLLFSTYRRTPA